MRKICLNKTNSSFQICTFQCHNMLRSWPLGCLMQRSLDYIFSDNYLLGFNFLKETVVGWEWD